MMADLQAIKKLLAEEYGIRSDRDLSEALRRAGKLDIGVLASPVRKDEQQNEKDCRIA